MIPDQSHPFDVDPGAPEQPAAPDGLAADLERAGKAGKRTIADFEGALRDAVLNPDEVDVLFHGLDKGIEANALADPPVADALRTIRRKLKFILTHFKENYGKE